MNYLEFKRQLMVDPYDRSSEFRAALLNDPDCESAAAESDSFETLLQSAVKVPVPENLVDLAIRQRYQDSSKRSTIAWLPAMAAGLMMGVGLTTAVFLFNGDNSGNLQSLEQHLASHWSKDGEITLQMAANNPMDTDGVQRVLATLNLVADEVLMDDILYARNCGTPHGNGVHMVVSTNDGMVTAIYIPEAEIDDSKLLKVLANDGLLVPMDKGTIALVAANRQSLDSSMGIIKAGLHENQRIET